MSKNDYYKPVCPHCGASYKVTQVGTNPTVKCWKCKKEFKGTARIAKETRQLRRAAKRNAEKKK